MKHASATLASRGEANVDVGERVVALVLIGLANDKAVSTKVSFCFSSFNVWNGYVSTYQEGVRGTSP